MSADRHSSREPAHLADAPILAVTDLGVSYNGHQVLQAITFCLAKGDQVAVVGPNGAGKSTLFKAIAGVWPHSAGEVRIGGSQPTGHICIAYLPQRAAIDWSFPVTVYDVVMMGRTGRLGWFHRPGRPDREFVMECLRAVRMDGLAQRRITALSGGEQQRMFIARALAQEAELMLMDEIMTGCDTPSREEIHRILEMLSDRRVTVMVSTHDLEEAAKRFERVLLINRRMIGFGLPSEVLVPVSLNHAYGHHLHVVQTPAGALVYSDTCDGGGGGKRA